MKRHRASTAPRLATAAAAPAAAPAACGALTSKSVRTLRGWAPSVGPSRCLTRPSHLTRWRLLSPCPVDFELHSLSLRFLGMAAVRYKVQRDSPHKPFPRSKDVLPLSEDVPVRQTSVKRKRYTRVMTPGNWSCHIRLTLQNGKSAQIRRGQRVNWAVDTTTAAAAARQT